MFADIYCRLGNKVVKRFIIGTKVVSGSPDIRYTCTNPLQRRVLLMLTEVPVFVICAGLFTRICKS